MSELLILAWLCKKYVQRADDRQKAMGLQYTEAETHDLAREIQNCVVAPAIQETERRIRKEIADGLRSSAFLHCDVDKEDVLLCIEHGPGTLSEIKARRDKDRIPYHDIVGGH